MFHHLPRLCAPTQTRLSRLARWFSGPRTTTRLGHRLTLEHCESRIAPATATLSSGVLTIDFTATGTTAESVTITDDSLNFKFTGNITSASMPKSGVTGIVIRDLGGSNNQAISYTNGFTILSLAQGFSCDGIESVTMNRYIEVLGSSHFTITTPRTVSLSNNISTVDGKLTIKANQQLTPSTGNFQGVIINGSLKSTSGAITVEGRGGDDTVGNQRGIYLAGSISGGTTGAVAVQGTGGASPGDGNYGVYLRGGDVISNGGNISVAGQGGGTGTSSNNYGIELSLQPQISAGGAGTVKVQGIGSATMGRVNAGIMFSDGIIRSSGGDVTVYGRGGGSGSNSSMNDGINIGNSAYEITAGGSGSVKVEGHGGGTIDSKDSLGIYGGSGKILAPGGDVWIIGSCQVSDVPAIGLGGMITAGGNLTVTAQAGPGVEGMHFSPSTTTLSGDIFLNSALSSTVGSEAWNSRDLKSRPH